MIGVDTNVLLRAFVADDLGHAERARRLLDQAVATGRPVLVNQITLCEFAWVLTRSFRLGREKVAAAIEAILVSGLEVADRDAALEALALFRGGRAGFADALIGVVNRRAGCEMTYTFDRAAAQLPDYALMPA